MIMREYFMETERIGFSHWTAEDLVLARSLWGDARVTQYIAKSGGFDDGEVQARLSLEIENQRLHGVSYWPVFEKRSGALLGCCGLRPFEAEGFVLEIGFHLLPEQWGKGYASEAARAAVRDAFDALGADRIVAGHHPENLASCAVLTRLGFRSIGDKFYAPTGLYHPSYELTRTMWTEREG